MYSISVIKESTKIPCDFDCIYVLGLLLSVKGVTI
jgi:hypothetical protein